MQLSAVAWCFSLLSLSDVTQWSNKLSMKPGESPLRLSAKAKRKKNKPGSKSSTKSTKLPRLVIFDLDGCLWKPELFELVTSADGPPFMQNPQDTVPGTTLLSQKRQRIELLGDTRQILHELYTKEEWYPSRIGISSRTDPPDWAHTLMEEFTVYEEVGHNRMTKEPKKIPQVTCQMKDVFDPSLCILDKSIDKATQFEKLLERANNQSGFGGGAGSKKTKRLQFKDIVFFDNEAGNCKQVQKLGVTSVYTPRGVTYEAWQNAIQNFPSNRVLGPKMPY